MNEEYLWDRSGEPEPEVVHLEQLLGQLRCPESTFRNVARTPLRSRIPRWAAWTIAAGVMLCMGLGFVAQRIFKPAAVTSWQLTFAGQKPSGVRTGQVIETKAIAGASMESDSVGEVEIRPNSRLRVMAAQHDQNRLALDHGTIHAFIWAPPAKFVVDTPSAKTVDLGCEYTLSVRNDGRGFLTVEMGWVAFQSHNIESFIPAGAACTTRPGHGPDTPHFLDAPEALTQALSEFDVSGNVSALHLALASARARDGLTLWHLLQRTRGSERGEVFDRFQALVHLPAGVTREAILSGNRQATDLAWDALQLGDTSWWREWKRQW